MADNGTSSSPGAATSKGEDDVAPSQLEFLSAAEEVIKVSRLPDNTYCGIVDAHCPSVEDAIKSHWGGGDYKLVGRMPGQKAMRTYTVRIKGEPKEEEEDTDDPGGVEPRYGYNLPPPPPPVQGFWPGQAPGYGSPFQPSPQVAAYSHYYARPNEEIERTRAQLSEERAKVVHLEAKLERAGEKIVELTGKIAAAEEQKRYAELQASFEKRLAEATRGRDEGGQGGAAQILSSYMEVLKAGNESQGTMMKAMLEQAQKHDPLEVAAKLASIQKGGMGEVREMLEVIGALKDEARGEEPQSAGWAGAVQAGLQSLPGLLAGFGAAARREPQQVGVSVEKPAALPPPAPVPQSFGPEATVSPDAMFEVLGKVTSYHGAGNAPGPSVAALCEYCDGRRIDVRALATSLSDTSADELKELVNTALATGSVPADKTGPLKAVQGMLAEEAGAKWIDEFLETFRSLVK